jgi:hypothetical protein
LDLTARCCFSDLTALGSAVLRAERFRLCTAALRIATKNPQLHGFCKAQRIPWQRNVPRSGPRVCCRRKRADAERASRRVAMECTAREARRRAARAPCDARRSRLRAQHNAARSIGPRSP